MEPVVMPFLTALPIITGYKMGVGLGLFYSAGISKSKVILVTKKIDIGNEIDNLTSYFWNHCFFLLVMGIDNLVKML